MSVCSASDALKKPHQGPSSWIFYGMPAMALAIPVVPSQVLLPDHYAGNTAVELGAVGLALLVARCFDIFSDPVIGWLTDRALSRGKGLRRLIFTGAVLCGFSLFMLFTPPPSADWIYLLIWSALLFTGWSVVQIPYTVYSARLTGNQTLRLKLNASREGFGLLGILSAALFAAFWPAEGPSSLLRDLAIVTLIAGAVSLLWFGWHFPTPLRPAKNALPPPVSWLNRMAGIWRYAPARRLVLAWLVNGIANGLPAICFPLYLRLVLEAGEGTYGQYLLLYFLAAVLSMPLWVLLARRWPKNKVWSWAMIIACSSFAFVPFLGAGDLLAFAAICLVTGMAFGADLALPPAIQADVADWTREDSGQDQTGMLFSVWSIATKLAFGLAAGIAFPFLGFFGVAQDAASASAQGLVALMVIYSMVPTVLKVIAISLVWSFSRTKSGTSDLRPQQQEKLR